MTKKYLPFVVLALGVIFFIGVFVKMRSGGSAQPTNEPEEVVAEIPQENRPFTSLTPKPDGHWLVLKIENFHWAETAWEVKRKFMDEVLKLNFKVKIAIVDNPVNPAVELERVLAHMVIERNIKKIYIDGKKPKWYERKIKKILRDKGISVRKLKTVKDSQYAGIRLADMVAGLSRSYFDKKNLDKISKYYKRLQEKIIVILE